MVPNLHKQIPTAVTKPSNIRALGTRKKSNGTKIRVAWALADRKTQTTLESVERLLADPETRPGVLKHLQARIKRDRDNLRNAKAQVDFAITLLRLGQPNYIPTDCLICLSDLEEPWVFLAGNKTCAEPPPCNLQNMQDQSPTRWKWGDHLPLRS